MRCRSLRDLGGLGIPCSPPPQFRCGSSLRRSSGYRATPAARGKYNSPSRITTVRQPTRRHIRRLLVVPRCRPRPLPTDTCPPWGQEHHRTRITPFPTHSRMVPLLRESDDVEKAACPVVLYRPRLGHAGPAADREDRFGHERQDPHRGDGALEADVDRTRPDRCLRAAPDRLTQLQGGCGLGVEDDDRFRAEERPPRTVHLARHWLAAGQGKRLHHLTGQGQHQVRGESLVAVDQGDRDRAGRFPWWRQ